MRVVALLLLTACDLGYGVTRKYPAARASEACLREALDSTREIAKVTDAPMGPGEPRWFWVARIDFADPNNAHGAVYRLHDDLFVSTGSMGTTNCNAVARGMAVMAELERRIRETCGPLPPAQEKRTYVSQCGTLREDPPPAPR
ncbi:MAG TPA: hypothetical protein VGH20_15120 [Myxococcales bacterium]|jgi:hypothetical protein